MRRRACTPGFSSALSTYSSPPSGLASQIRSYRSNTRAALTAKYGSRGDPGPLPPRLAHVLRQPAAHRARRDRRRDAPGRGLAGRAAPLRQRRPARRGQLARQRLHLRDRQCGERARPARCACGRPTSPPSANRLRQRLTTSTSSRWAIAVFANPSAAIRCFTAPRTRSPAPGRTRRGSRIAAGIQDSRDHPSRLADEPSPAAWPPMVIWRVASRHSDRPLGVRAVSRIASRY